MRRAGLAVAIAGALLLAGCTAGPEVSADGSSPIFDRPRAADDALPEGYWGSVAEDTSRYVGEDSAGNAYWAVRNADDAECIVDLPVDDAGPSVFCGGPGVTGTTTDGRVIEFASSPSRLTPAIAEMVGDTLLVKASR